MIAIIAAALLLPAAAFAQQPQFDPDRVAYGVTQSALALAQFASVEAREIAALRAQATESQAKIADLQKQLSELRAKYEPEAEPPKKD